MDPGETPNMVLETSIGYATSISVTLMDEVAVVNERVLNPFNEYFNFH